MIWFILLILQTYFTPYWKYRSKSITSHSCFRLWFLTRENLWQSWGKKNSKKRGEYKKPWTNWKIFFWRKEDNYQDVFSKWDRIKNKLLLGDKHFHAKELIKVELENRSYYWMWVITNSVRFDINVPDWFRKGDLKAFHSDSCFVEKFLVSWRNFTNDVRL